MLRETTLIAMYNSPEAPPDLRETAVALQDCDKDHQKLISSLRR
jgi:hypothetical protein